MGYEGVDCSTSLLLVFPTIDFKISTMVFWTMILNEFHSNRYVESLVTTKIYNAFYKSCHATAWAWVMPSYVMGMIGHTQGPEQLSPLGPDRFGTG
jgi:hypothetical protein